MSLLASSYTHTRTHIQIPEHHSHYDAGLRRDTGQGGTARPGIYAGGALQHSTLSLPLHPLTLQLHSDRISHHCLQRFSAFPNLRGVKHSFHFVNYSQRSTVVSIICMTFCNYWGLFHYHYICFHIFPIREAGSVSLISLVRRNSGTRTELWRVWLLF